ncbi:S9 family peptidase [Candidatus Fermentibacterales bacterium]|nr:S9 family peptidase [Candidatus Fermentibacterales bacterium]
MNDRSREDGKLRYPRARRQDLVEDLHGMPVADPYRWLEELDSDETREWIEAQNRLTFGYLEKLPRRVEIRKRLQELWDYERFGVPFRKGTRYFYFHNDGLQNQSPLYWSEGLEGEPRLLVDPNTLSTDGTVAIGPVAVSEDGKLLAYAVSSSGSDWREVRVREVDTGRDREDHLKWMKFSTLSWTHDGRGFFYSRYDEPEEGLTYKGANYFHKIYYHGLGSPQCEDTVVYERPDRKEWLFHSSVTEDGRYLVVMVHSGTQRENGVFLLDLERPDAGMVELLAEFDAEYVYAGNRGALFYFLSDLEAPRRRVITVGLEKGACSLRTLIPESGDVLEHATLVGGRLVACYLRDACSAVRFFEPDGSAVGDLDLPGIGSVHGFGGRFDDPETFFFYTSFSVPGSIYRLDMRSLRYALFREPELGFDPEEYETSQVFYSSKDGTRIPMFLCHGKGIERNGENRVLLTGYGGFGASITPGFSVPPLVWMEMGGIVARPNLRGGGEYGTEWHDAGRLSNKQNVFDDFIAAAEWLISEGYTKRANLAISGGSNGGLLIGACMTQRPDLFGACLPDVGVMDMLRFHRFTIGWAWTSDYGSPDDPEQFRALLAYSPYHNLRRGVCYPPTLVTTADHDDRVFPAHSFKFAAELQHAQTCGNPVLIRIETRAGHGASTPVSKRIEAWADKWAFVMGTQHLSPDAMTRGEPAGESRVGD